MKRSEVRNAYGRAILFNEMLWVPTHPGVNFDMLGFIPTFLSALDPDPAWKQIDKNYGHGGGWRPFPGFKLLEDGTDSMKYPGDPPTRALFHTALREERIHFYQHAWVRITQPDGTWEVCRVD